MYLQMQTAAGEQQNKICLITPPRVTRVGLGVGVPPLSDDVSVFLQSFFGCFLRRKLDKGLSRVSSEVVGDDGDPVLHNIQT